MSDIDSVDPNASSTPGGNRLLRAFTSNSVAANLTMLVMLIGGFFAWTNLTSQTFPTLDFGIAFINLSLVSKKRGTQERPLTTSSATII